MTKGSIAMKKFSGTFAVLAAATMLATPALAATAPSSNAMINLVRLLVAQGTISKKKGEALIAEAEREAEEARAAQVASAAPVAPVPAAPKLADAQSSAPPAPAGTIRVPYIPETVRQQIREEVKADVLKTAEKQGWASPGKAAPEWVRNVRLYGDLRLRSQSNLFSRFNSDQIPNFQAIVAGGPLDLVQAQIPLLNTTQDRVNQMRLRMRLGLDFTIDSRLKVGVEIGTGNDNSSPVAENANLGNHFVQRGLYINKAYAQMRATDGLTLTAGRMDNPFLSTDALFDPDLRFDGFAFEAHAKMDMMGLEGLRLRGGAFPLAFGGANFPDTATVKSNPPQKWLFSAQLEGEYSLLGDSSLRLAGAYHHFLNVSGRPSQPCALYLGVTQCSSDGTTPFFVQKGNTLSFIRRIVLDPTLPSTTVQAQPQLLGLTMPYHILNATAVFKKPVGETREFSLVADYLRNMAFKRSDACRYGVAGQPVNNGGAGGNGNICDAVRANRTPFVGGKNAFQVVATYGTPAPRNWGEWKAWLGYKYIESDAVLDAFNDDNFHLGGTNAKGFTLGGTLGLRRNTTIGARWMSTNQVSGDPFAVDILQLDLSLSF
jgi:hypothetical protein